MGYAIQNCQGIVHVFGGNVGTKLVGGFYEVKPPIPSTPKTEALILGAPLAFQEIVQPTTTLDDKRSLYLFGSAWNEMSLTGILLLGRSGNVTFGFADQLGLLIKWYNENRVSQSEDGRPVEVSLGSVAIDAYVIGLRLEAANAKNNTQMFSIMLVTADTE